MTKLVWPKDVRSLRKVRKKQFEARGNFITEVLNKNVRKMRETD